jgi:hypothetical protein
MKPIRHRQARIAYGLCITVQATLLIALALISTATASSHTRGTGHADGVAEADHPGRATR